MGSYFMYLLLTIFVVVVLIAESSAGRQCGVEASSNPLHQSPWTVLLEFYRRGQLTEFRCGGTLIDSLHVITAAHCVRRIKHHLLQVRLGDYDLSSKVDCIDGVCADPFVTRVVTEVFVHPGFNQLEHDVAILKMNEPVTFTDFIRPVCLPTGTVDDTTVFHAAGWGEVIHTGRYSDVKKTIPLPFWPHDDCRHIYRRDVIPRLSICAGGRKDFDTCRGDSGGPLTAKRRNIELFGITSSGPTSCGREGAPGIYTSVREHLPWIHQVMRVT